MGGITGPCPSCQVLIQAPFSMTQQPLPAQHQQVPAPTPQSEYEFNRTPQLVAGNPNILRPEPRQRPSAGMDPTRAQTRVHSEPSGVTRTLSGSPGPPPQRRHRSRFLRLLVPLTFICVALGVMYGVKTMLQMDRGGKAKADKPAMAGGNGQEAGKPILPPDDNSFESLTGTEGKPDLAVADPPMPAIGDVPNEFPHELQPVDGGIAALALLEKFLSMKTLDERLPHIETKRPEEDLISSVLNGPLPEALKVSVDVSETNAIEQVIDYYYHVVFATGDGGENPQTMLVRTRGTSPPKVVVDPFLDLFGGRFAAYAAKPSEDAATFQIIISAGAFCYDDVPGADKKFTLKILSRDDNKEVAKAYFGKRSKIGEMLEDETSGLAYGQAKPCTVFMRWNTEEDPERPFLEALDIKALNWNP
jgi:hypothetical protein